MEATTEQTLCIIKPDALRGLKENEIMQLVELDGFHILDKRRIQMSLSDVMDFYSEHVGKPFFSKLQSFMSSGPILALILAKPDAIGALRALMGPTDSDIARQTAPRTLRALYGTDGTENAVHGSDSAQSVRREIKFFFPHRQVISPSPGTKPAIPKSLEDALCQGLTALAKQKPSHDPSTAIIWLGNWLLKHNPNKPLVYGPDELSLDEVDDGTEFPAFLPVQEDVQVDGSSHEQAESQVQRTLAMIKPDAVAAGHSQAIIDSIEDAGFKILRRRYYMLYPAQAELFYAEHSGKVFFDKLVEFMTSGPIWALEIEGVDGIAEWRKLMGPANTLAAALDAPESLRARFGTDGTKNATHGSDSAESAAREIAFHFPPVETTLAMIKPDAVSAGVASTIMERIERQGFKIVKKRSYQLTQERAESFYSDHIGKPFFPRLIEFMTSGPIWALALEMPGAIAAWRAMMGPTNSAVAKSTAPTTLRAHFGSDGTMNAVHGSDSPESAARETELHFQAFRRDLATNDIPEAEFSHHQPGVAVTHMATNERTEAELAEEQAAAITVQAAVRGRRARQRVGRMQQDPQVAVHGSSEAIPVDETLAVESSDGMTNTVQTHDTEASDAPDGVVALESVDNREFEGGRSSLAERVVQPGLAEDTGAQSSGKEAESPPPRPEVSKGEDGSNEDIINAGPAYTDSVHEDVDSRKAEPGTQLDHSTYEAKEVAADEGATPVAEANIQT